MLHRAAVGPHDPVLVAGTSGGVGSAPVQLAKRRGARVTVIAGKAKLQQVMAGGADHVILRGEDPAELLGAGSVDVVVDNVAGPQFGRRFKVLKRALDASGRLGPVNTPT